MFMSMASIFTVGMAIVADIHVAHRPFGLHQLETISTQLRSADRSLGSSVSLELLIAPLSRPGHARGLYRSRGLRVISGHKLSSLPEPGSGGLLLDHCCSVASALALQPWRGSSP